MDEEKSKKIYLLKVYRVSLFGLKVSLASAAGGFLSLLPVTLHLFRPLTQLLSPFTRKSSGIPHGIPLTFFKTAYAVVIRRIWCG